MSVIGFISKYPPIEGYTSSYTYWLARAIAKKGHRIHIITNAWEVEDDYREQFRGKDLDYYQPDGVVVHNTDPFVDPFLIPYFTAYTEKLSTLALQMVSQHSIELIDTWYLIPYGTAGFNVKNITGLPLIIRHAGSDITRLFTTYRAMMEAVLKKADAVCTFPHLKDRFLGMGIMEEKIWPQMVSVDTTAFNPNVTPINLSEYGSDWGGPIITYIGKCGRGKGLRHLLDALSGINEEYLLLLVCGGRGYNDVMQRIKKLNLSKNILTIPFQPPWRIPRIISASTVVVLPEHDFPVKEHMPILPREVWACGKCSMLSSELFEKYKRHGLRDGEELIVSDFRNVALTREKLRNIIKSPDKTIEIGKKAYQFSQKYENFDDAINAIEKMYTHLLSK